MWIEDDERDSAAWLATKKGERELRGFDARRYHMVEPHEGNMWALAAYVPRASRSHNAGAHLVFPSHGPQVLHNIMTRRFHLNINCLFKQRFRHCRDFAPQTAMAPKHHAAPQFFWILGPPAGTVPRRPTAAGRFASRSRHGPSPISGCEPSVVPRAHRPSRVRHRASWPCILAGSPSSPSSPSPCRPPPFAVARRRRRPPSQGRIVERLGALKLGPL